MLIIITVLIGIATTIIVTTMWLISSITKYNNCILEIPGTLISLRQEDSGISEYSGTIVYRPVVIYEYNGHEYTYYHIIAKTSYKDLKIGMKINMRINPNNPEQVICKI